ncbi:hypothetical protein [Flavihumibacter petaseus]|uniref:DUF4279 domain-containing protein n=1 Tax=Flavihumibacter petaseus NBRC 106054 TaxID=1220578 RepID=A0A0E9N2Q4_9BACT|nr:hypothetical protein [Flavihumibacter petaseus]GAO44124.1 hypothetical protein FPE01S_03_01630 [Flavihumibacter petaseus NBRC 106054]
MSTYIELEVKGTSEVVSTIKKEFEDSQREFESSWSVLFDIDEMGFNKAFDSAFNILRSMNEKNILPHNDDGRVAIWFMYEYEGQCNIEFPLSLIKEMAELNITLNISCWEK